MPLPWWARPTTKHPPKEETNKQTKERGGPKKLDQEAHKTPNWVTNLLIASSNVTTLLLYSKLGGSSIGFLN